MLLPVEPRADVERLHAAPLPQKVAQEDATIEPAAGEKADGGRKGTHRAAACGRTAERWSGQAASLPRGLESQHLVHSLADVEENVFAAAANLRGRPAVVADFAEGLQHLRPVLVPFADLAPGVLVAVSL